MNRNQKQTVLGQFFHHKLPDQIQIKPISKEVVQQLERKTRQVAILNQVNTRLGQQLISLQEKLGISRQQVISKLQNLNQISIAFHFDTEQLEYLDVLFTSYDDAILKLRKMIGKLYSQLTEIQSRADKLLKDNTFLMERLESQNKTILQIYSNGFPEENLASIYIKLQRQDQDQQIKLIKQQNQYLINNYNELKQKLVQTQTDHQNQIVQAQKYFNTYKNQAQEAKQIQIRCSELQKIKNVLQAKFHQITQQNLVLENIKGQLQTKVTKLENQNRLMKVQLTNLRRGQKENQDKNLQQISILKQENQTFASRQRQHFSKLLMTQKQLQNCKQNLRKTKRESQQTKKDFQQTLKMLQTYQLKINNYIKKEQSTDLLNKNQRAKLQQALLQRDKSILKQQQLQKHIDNITAKHRQEIASVSQSFQKIIKSQTQKIKSLQELIEEEQSSYTQTQTNLKNQLEKLKREISQLKQENIKYMKNLKSSGSDDLINKVKQYQQRNEALKKIIQQHEKNHKQTLQDKNENIRHLQSQNRQLSRQLDKQRSNNRQLNNQKSALKSKLSISMKERDSLTQEIQRVKKNYEYRVSSFQNQQNGKINQVKEKLEEALRRQRNARQKAIKMLEGYDEAEEKLKYEYQSRIRQLELQNENLRSKLLIKKR